MAYRKQILVDTTKPNFILAGPANPGSDQPPVFRPLTVNDIPQLPVTKIIDLPVPNVTLSGDATGSGQSNISVTLVSTGVTPGIYTSVTVDSKGRVIGGYSPTTLSGYGITDAVSVASLGVAGGVATLDVAGKVKVEQLPEAVFGGLSYLGTWNAVTNEPAIPAAALTNRGSYYKVNTAGSTNIDGITDWNVGDWIISNGSTWDRIDNTDQVFSVAGKVGNIILNTDDVSEGTNLYFTNTRAVTAPLTGFVLGTNTTIDAADNILQAMGKIQAQLNAKQATGSYLTENQTINVTGDATGSGKTDLTLTLIPVGTAGTYRSVTTDVKGRVISGNEAEIVKVFTATTNYIMNSMDSVVFVDASAGPVEVTLPSNPELGRVCTVKRIDGTSNSISVNGNTKNIDESLIQTITAQYDSLAFIYNGSQWFIV